MAQIAAAPTATGWPVRLLLPMVASGTRLRNRLGLMVAGVLPKGGWIEMSVRRVQRYTEQDLQRVVALRDGGAPVDVLEFIDATRLPGEVERSPAQAIGSGTDAYVAGTQGGFVMLPWPPKELSPNAREHWAVKNRAVKLYRESCAWLTRASGLRVDWDGIVHAWITFYPPDRRHRDDDNLIAAFKSGRDGLADALSINDKRFRIHPWLSDDVVKGGAVKVRLSPGPEDEDRPAVHSLRRLRSHQCQRHQHPPVRSHPIQDQ